jgi:hypothetical protein
MLYINKITSSPSQLLTLTGIPGIQIAMSLQFMPRIEQWQMGISYPGFSAQGIAVVGSLNLLRSWKNVIPFGMACICADSLDPYQVTDFANLRANLYLLNSADVAQVESDWFT